jgi:hypothetical protein
MSDFPDTVKAIVYLSKMNIEKINADLRVTFAKMAEANRAATRAIRDFGIAISELEKLNKKQD